jgi:hypothetical protein
MPTLDAWDWAVLLVGALVWIPLLVGTVSLIVLAVCVVIDYTHWLFTKGR